MSEKEKFDTIFKSYFPNVSQLNQLNDQNLQSMAAKIQLCVKEIQTNYDSKKDFRKSEAPQRITENLAEALQMLIQKQQEIDQLKININQKEKQLNEAIANSTNLSKQSEHQKQSFNEKEKNFLEIFKEKDIEIQTIKDTMNKNIKKQKLDDSLQVTNEYDIIIDIKSLFNIQNEPVKILYSNKSGVTKKDLQEMEQCSVVGIQGLKNKGKTFLLNELNQEHFPSGFHYSTSGISVKIDNSDIDNIKVYLDSEGINKPARYKWKQDEDFQNYTKIMMENEDESLFQNKNESQLQKRFQTRVVEKFQDIKSTEQIQQQFLLEYSETIIIVVGIISLEEQKLISNIGEECEKDIIVVHNLKEYSKREHVEEEIEKNLHDYFPLDMQGIILDRSKSDLFSSVYQDQRNEKVFHCILAQKGSSAGEYYNEFTYNFIKQKIQLNNIKKPLCIASDFCYFLNNILRDFVEIRYQSEEKKAQKIQPGEELLQFTGGDESDEITLKSEFQIESIKDILLDVFGRIRNKVNYSIYQHQDIKTVEIELPGDVLLTKASLIKEEEYQVLVLQANKKTSWQDQQGTQELFNNRNLGQISHKIKIGKTTENLKLQKTFSCEKGVYTAQYKITNTDVLLQMKDDK